MVPGYNAILVKKRKTGYKAIFPEKSKTVNQQVKNSVNGAQGTRLFLRRRVKQNHPVKNYVKGTQGTMLFSQERVRLKIKRSKISLRVNSVRC